MATPVFIPVSKYLSTMCRPDCDYVDGIVRVELADIFAQSDDLLAARL